VVKRSRTFVEASGMPGIRKLKMLKVEMVAVFVAKCADKGPKRGDVFLHCGPHPDPDGHGGGIVVTEKFTGPVLTNAQRTRSQDADSYLQTSGRMMSIGSFE